MKKNKMNTISIHKIIKDFLFLSLIALLFTLISSVQLKQVEKEQINTGKESTEYNNIDSGKHLNTKSFLKLIEINNK